MTEKKQFCAIGTLKSNIGHLDNVSGLGGLAKIILSMEHGRIPASINFDVPNRNISFIDGPVYVQLIKAAIKARQAAKIRKQKEAERAAWSRSRSEINYAVPGKVRCRSCWFDNPPGVDFCQSCSSRLPENKAPR